MEPTTLPNARKNLSALVRAAQRGDDVVLTRNGRAVVRMVPVGAPRFTGAALLDSLIRRPRPPVSAGADVDASIADIRASWGS